MKVRGFAIFVAAGFSFALFGVNSAYSAKGPADLEIIRKNMDRDFEEKPWVEVETQLPSPPVEKNLVRISVSATNENRFWVDESSVTIDTDEVIRYVLVITSPTGARNVSYEGMRCATAERRLYAFGRADGSWSKARSSQWVRIEDNTLNRHHAALYSEYFCTTGGFVTSAESARRALRGGNPVFNQFNR